MSGIEIFNITFLNPYYFLLIIFVLILIFFYLKTKKKGINFLFLNEIKQVYRHNSWIYYLKTFVLILIFALYIIILANPNISNQKKSVNNSGIDIVLDMDVSYSMMAVDFKPNRMEASKKVIKNFISKLETDRLGLTVFAGKPFTSAPLTFDYRFMEEIVSETTVDTINQNNSRFQGTAIGDSILTSINLFKDSENREKVIVLLTDGEANAGLDPLVAAKFAKDKGVRIYTIGIGSKEGGYMEQKTPFGLQRQAVNGVDEKTLNSIADTTGGKYYRATDENSLKKIFSEIEKLDKNEIEIETTQLYQEYNKPFVYSLITFMLLYIILSFVYFVKE